MKNNIFILAAASFVLFACENKSTDSSKTAESMNENTFEGTDIKKDVTFASSAA